MKRVLVLMLFVLLLAVRVIIAAPIDELKLMKPLPITHVLDSWRMTSGAIDPSNEWQVEMCRIFGSVTVRIGANPTGAIEVAKKLDVPLVGIFWPGMDHGTGNHIQSLNDGDRYVAQYVKALRRTVNACTRFNKPLEVVLFDSERFRIGADALQWRTWHNRFVFETLNHFPKARIIWWGGSRHPYPSNDEQPQGLQRYASCSLYDTQDIQDTIKELGECTEQASSQEWAGCIPCVSIGIDIKPGVQIDTLDSFLLGHIIESANVDMVWCYPAFGDQNKLRNTMMTKQDWVDHLDAYKRGFDVCLKYRKPP